MHKNQGLYRAAVFAVLAKKTGSCGDDLAENILWEYIQHDSETNEGAARVALKSFINLYSNLRLIAQINDIQDPFDLRVVNAYILGDENLIKEFPIENFNILVEFFKEVGKIIVILDSEDPEEIFKDDKKFRDLFEKMEGFEIRQLLRTVDLPQSLIPLHIMYLMVSAIADSAPLDPKMLTGTNTCMTKPGKVKKVLEKDGKYTKLLVETVTVTVKAKKYVLIPTEEVVELDSRLGLSIDKGDLVLLHRKLVVFKITEEPETVETVLLNQIEMVLNSFNK